MININKNKEEYIKRFKERLGHREGMLNLLDFIVNKTDFFTAPATQSDFLSVSGGNAQYVLMLNDLVNEMFSHGAFAYALNMKDDKGKPLVTKEFIDTTTLLIGLDNIFLYKMSLKNRKTFDPKVVAEYQARGESVRTDIINGQAMPYVWESYEGYEYEDVFASGEGTRILGFTQGFVTLKKEEFVALKWAKTILAVGHDKGSMWTALNNNVLALALQVAHSTIRHLIANEKYLDQFAQYYGSSKEVTATDVDDVMPNSSLTNEELDIQNIVQDDSYNDIAVEEFPFDLEDTSSVDATKNEVEEELTSTVDESDDFLANLDALDKAMFS